VITGRSLLIAAALSFAPTIGSGASVPVVAAKSQAALLKSRDPKLAANKRLAYDFFRIVLRGRQLDQAPKFMHVDYIQHNPNVDTGLKGFLEFFGKLGGPRDVPAELPGLVAIQAEGDFVTLSFVSENKAPGASGEAYTTTWFDMFRIRDGKIAEHWDCDLKGS
jgi:predicted SnoaL-like aldol condensation-catalyzing enzyme